MTSNLLLYLQKFPKRDLRVSTNRLNIRTCSDSCKALMELIRYFATDGDLNVEEPVDLDSTGTSDDIISTDDVSNFTSYNDNCLNQAPMNLN